MALPIATPLTAGALVGTVCNFVSPGDVLPMHDHGPDAAHITIIARGAFRVSGHGWSQISGAGDVLDFAPGNPHEFEAMEAGSRLVNIVKGVAS